MNKSMLIALLLATTTSAVSANQLSERNAVERGLTLKDGEIQLGGAVSYGKTGDEDDTGLVLGGAFGINDDLTVGLGGVRYRFMARPGDGNGLEVTVGGGIKGHLEQNDDDVWGYGADVLGKYVVSNNLAFTFGAEYVFWNTPGSDNAKEYRYSVGTLYSPIDDVTFSLGYTFRDLHDFSQDNAYTVSTGVNYAWSENMDVGLAFSYSDFDAVKNGFDLKSSHKRNLGAYVSYRF